MKAGLPIGEGADEFAMWRTEIDKWGLEHLFGTAAHAEKLRQVGLGDDLWDCAQEDLTSVVPQAIGRNEFGVTVRKHESTSR